MGPDKRAAYTTLFTVLRGLLRLVAPFAPFVAEELYQGLRAAVDGSSPRFPEPEADRIDEALEETMGMAVELASLGRTARNAARIKVRQPLRRLLVWDARGRVQKLLDHDEIRRIVTEELNVKAVDAADDPTAVAKLEARPRSSAVGRRFGRRTAEVTRAIQAVPPEKLLDFLRSGRIVLDTEEGPVELDRSELDVRVEGKEGFAAAEAGGVIVALDLEITPELALEGYARETINRVQNLRKKAGFEVTDRIELRYRGGETADALFARFGETIAREVLAASIQSAEVEWPHAATLALGEESLRLWIRRADERD
jgi:isoleucyl-tRNA synthetase